MKQHITKYQEVDSNKIVGERIEIKGGTIFVLDFGRDKLSFLTDVDPEEELLSVEEQIEKEDNAWLFDGESDSDYEDLDYTDSIYFEGQEFSKRKDFKMVKDDSFGLSPIEFIVYENGDDYFVIFSKTEEESEKEVSFFTASKY